VGTLLIGHFFDAPLPMEVATPWHGTACPPCALSERLRQTGRLDRQIVVHASGAPPPPGAGAAGLERSRSYVGIACVALIQLYMSVRLSVSLATPRCCWRCSRSPWGSFAWPFVCLFTPCCCWRCSRSPRGVHQHGLLFVWARAQTNHPSVRPSVCLSVYPSFCWRRSGIASTGSCRRRWSRSSKNYTVQTNRTR
jgi:hypothetical protein